MALVIPQLRWWWVVCAPLSVACAEPTASPASNKPIVVLPRAPNPPSPASSAPPPAAPDQFATLVGTWGCRGSVSHIAQFYRVALTLHEGGRFELDYRDVSPSGGRVVRMEGAWHAKTTEDIYSVRAVADVGSYRTWAGDMHRQHHRRAGDPPYADERERRGVYTHERIWVLSLDPQGAPRLRLDSDIGTRLGRGAASGEDASFPRCDPGEFNPS